MVCFMAILALLGKIFHVIYLGLWYSKQGVCYMASKQVYNFGIFITWVNIPGMKTWPSNAGCLAALGCVTIHWHRQASSQDCEAQLSCLWVGSLGLAGRAVAGWTVAAASHHVIIESSWWLRPLNLIIDSDYPADGPAWAESSWWHASWLWRPAYHTSGLSDSGCHCQSQTDPNWPQGRVLELLRGNISLLSARFITQTWIN